MKLIGLLGFKRQDLGGIGLVFSREFLCFARIDGVVVSAWY